MKSIDSSANAKEATKPIMAAQTQQNPSSAQAQKVPAPEARAPEQEPKTSQYALPVDASPKPSAPTGTPGALHLLSFDLTLSGFKEHLKEFIEHVPEDVRKSFGDAMKAVDDMEKGADRHYLRITDGSGDGSMSVDGTFGIVCINFDLKCFTERRMYIRHFSLRDKSRFEEAFKMVVDFVWRTFDCDTIRLDLYHFYKTIDGKEE